MNWRESAFGLDLRSLAVCRIATGLIVFGDLLARAGCFRMHYTELGILPRQALHEIGIARFPSLYLVSGWDGYIAALFVLHGLLALSLSVGYQTRLSAILTWYLTVSLQQRNYMVNNGGDTVLGLVLLWGIFLPWGDVLSVDAAVKARDGRQPLDSYRAYSPATAAMAFQMPFIYWLSVFHKIEPSWMKGEVLYYAFQSDLYSRPISQLLLPYGLLMKGLAYGTLLWEALGPFLLLSSRWRWRTAACLAFMVMHLGFGIFLRIGTFAFSPSIFLLALLPGAFWEQERISRLLGRIEQLFAKLAGRALPAKWDLLVWSRELKWAILTIFLFGSLIAIGQDSRVGRLLPKRLDELAQFTGLYQRWSVFVNLPAVPDGWFVVEGRLSDGREVDLFQGFEPVRWEKPPTPYSRYDSFRWPTPMVVISGDARFHKWFVRALTLDWEADHPGDRVTWVRFTYMKEQTLPEFRDNPVQRRRLWEGVPER